MKLPTLISFSLFLVGVVLFLLQLWFQICSPELFIKLMITDGALFVISFVVAFLIKESKATERITKGNSGLD